jgi:hypothetical protein
MNKVALKERISSGSKRHCSPGMAIAHFLNGIHCKCARESDRTIIKRAPL